MNVRTPVSKTLAALLTILFVVGQATAASASGTESRSYVANGVITVFCEGDQDVHLHEPWCLAMNAISGDEESAIGGVSFDVEARLGQTVIYGTNDIVGTDPHTMLGISDHVGIEHAVEGCGSLMLQIPPDLEGDDIDHGIHLVGQISLVHVDDDMTVCVGSSGEATASFF